MDTIKNLVNLDSILRRLVEYDDINYDFNFGAYSLPSSPAVLPTNPFERSWDELCTFVGHCYLLSYDCNASALSS